MKVADSPFRYLMLTLLLLITATGHGQEKFPLQHGPLEITGEPGANRYFDVVGRKGFLMGYEAGAMEAWLTPFKVAHNLHLTFDRKDFTRPVQSQHLARWITVRPEFTRITYAYEDFTVDMITFVALNEPAIVFLLDVNTPKEMTVSFNFITDMKPMWPAAIGGQYSFWNADEKAFLLSESRRRYNVLIGSPAADQAFATPAHRLSEVPNRFDITVTPGQAGARYIPIVIAGGKMERDAAVQLYRQILEKVPELQAERAEHAAYLREDLVQIDTPNDRFDQAFEWGKVALDDGISTNPDLGTGLVAGYGLSGRSERPGFAWFFGGDLFQAQFSMNAYGAQAETEQCLSFIRKYQRDDGKIMHELSQGAGFINWFEDYPYGYYHLETSPYYILSVANSVRHSGNLEFLRASWPSMIKAYEYALTTESNGDMLPENRLGGLGAIEVGAFREMMATDIYVAGVWVKALEDLMEMAGYIGETLPEGIAEIHKRARQSLHELFWDEEKELYGLAIDKEGKPISELTPWAALPMTMHLLPEEEGTATLKKISGPLVSTDWTVRMVSTASQYFDPVHYNLGAAWGVLSGYAGMAHYSYHRPQAGWQVIEPMIGLTYEDSRGDISEVYSGAYHLPLKQSVDHQMFSTGGFMGPVLRGLIGFHPHIPAGSIHLGPQLPAEWTHFSVKNLKAGDALISLNMLREGKTATYKITASRPTPLTLEFAPSYPLDTRVAAVLVNGQETPFNFEEKGTVSVLQLEMELAESTTVEVHFERMQWLQLPAVYGSLGSLPQQIRFIDMKNDAGQYRIELSGRKGWRYQTVLRNLESAIPVVIEVPGEDDGSFAPVEYMWEH